VDTIFALATARGRAGVAVVRLSGPRAAAAAREVAGALPPARRLALREIRDGTEVLDRALVVHFPRGASFTGEEVVEFHLHGSIAIVQAVLRRIGRIEGLRLAQPGEFTRRALANERLDLSEVEGLADLIEAETEAQRRQAMRVMAGALGERAAQWRKAAIAILARVEVGIDFAEEDLPPEESLGVTRAIGDLIGDLEAELRGYTAAERIREGFEVAILGPPNAGKSTLLNRLAGREAAITSEIAGTTRDVIEVRMEIGGLAVTLLDTAGLRETTDPVEAIGISRTRTRADAADLRIVLIAPDGSGADDLALGPDDIVLHGKCDITHRTPGVSGRTGEGIDALFAQIAERLGARTASAGLVTRARHRAAVEGAVRALQAAAEPKGAELRAEDLRQALRQLDSIVGRVDVEHILDEIFAAFCIGK
jgi:tRNA modification GTPase